VIDRLLRSADFERVLRTSTHVRSVHFAVHHLRDAPSKPSRPARVAQRKLSTGRFDASPLPVDESAASAPKASPEVLIPALSGLWLGAVVPKRHARRAVTRNLLKRQIRAAVTGQQHRLAHGLWVVRLRAPFDKVQFPSAASSVLQVAARTELDQLLARAAQR
jgi:ribonuclease P protein component